jgi:tetratricopeptide (TPR) repeat protein
MWRWWWFPIAAGAVWAGELEQARDAQDGAALAALARRYEAAAGKQAGANAHYLAALAHSYLAEVALEAGDKKQARAAAETGIAAAQKAVAANPAAAEYHRVLGALCAQVIPANVLAGLKWGTCARDEVQKAVDLEPRGAMHYVTRGVGYYYLPAALGGGVENAIKDFEQALALDAKLAEAHLWMGVALRKAGRNAAARRSLERAAGLSPGRTWIRQQLDKTPAR